MNACETADRPQIHLYASGNERLIKRLICELKCPCSANDPTMFAVHLTQGELLEVTRGEQERLSRLNKRKLWRVPWNTKHDRAFVQFGRRILKLVSSSPCDLLSEFVPPRPDPSRVITLLVPEQPLLRTLTSPRLARQLRATSHELAGIVEKNLQRCDRVEQAAIPPGERVWRLKRSIAAHEASFSGKAPRTLRVTLASEINGAIELTSSWVLPEGEKAALMMLKTLLRYDLSTWRRVGKLETRRISTVIQPRWVIDMKPCCGRLTKVAEPLVDSLMSYRAAIAAGHPSLILLSDVATPDPALKEDARRLMERMHIFDANRSPRRRPGKTLPIIAFDEPLAAGRRQRGWEIRKEIRINARVNRVSGSSRKTKVIPRHPDLHPHELGTWSFAPRNAVIDWHVTRRRRKPFRR